MNVRIAEGPTKGRAKMKARSSRGQRPKDFRVNQKKKWLKKGCPPGTWGKRGEVIQT